MGRAAGATLGTRITRAPGAPGQLWLFWLAPIAGAILGGLIYRYVLDEDSPVNAANLPVAAAPVQSTSE